jgi:hypothetical protein
MRGLSTFAVASNMPMHMTRTGARNRTAIASVAAQREGFVVKYQDHQRRAAECLRLARDATDKTNKALLIEMAQTWAKLAEQEKARAGDEKPE